MMAGVIWACRVGAGMMCCLCSSRLRITFWGRVDRFMASGGEWRVELPRVRWQVLGGVREAAAEMGIAAVDDFNTGDNAGSGYFHVNQKNGRRWSAARGFLKPVMKRANLRVETGCAQRGRW